jgi:hypothetical protein
MQVAMDELKSHPKLIMRIVFQVVDIVFTLISLVKCKVQFDDDQWYDDKDIDDPYVRKHEGTPVIDLPVGQALAVFISLSFVYSVLDIITEGELFFDKGSELGKPKLLQFAYVWAVAVPELICC